MDAQTVATIQKFAAKKQFSDPAAIMAVAFTESAGVFFWTIDGEKRPAIRFEGHYFDRILKKEHPALLAKARQQGLANPTAGAVRNPNSWKARYELFERACAINKAAAIRSVSWGLGQVMGDHWKTLGFSSPEDLMNTCYEGVAGQLELMWRFIEKNKLVTKLKNHDWAGFAKVYNGPAYKKNNYDTNMAKAYARFKQNPADAHIKLVQERLAKLGLYTGKIDGYDGPKTDKAIRTFQDAAGLVIDGEPGSVTIEALDRFIAEKASKKQRNNIPIVAGGATALAGGIGPVLDAMDTTQSVANSASGLLSTMNIGGIVAAVIVAIIVVVVLGVMIKKVRSDNTADTLDAVTE